MADITGIVQEIKTRSVAGGKTSYDVVVGGQAYGAGLYAPKCKVGDYIKFELDDSRGYKNVGRNSMKVSANKPPAEAMAEAAATAPKQSTTGGSFDSRQDAISRQAASNTAISFMTLLNVAGALPVATAKGKAQETLEAILHKYEQEFYERNTGVKWKNISPGADETVAVETTAPTPAPEVAAPADDEWK